MFLTTISRWREGQLIKPETLGSEEAGGPANTLVLSQISLQSGAGKVGMVGWQAW